MYTQIDGSIPHACGGDPSFIGQAQKVMAGIPHACGGDPQTIADLKADKTVFPTHVGVILTSESQNLATFRIPHACGGDPTIYSWQKKSPGYSPRMWG